jgi:hypothetical protein
MIRAHGVSRWTRLLLVAAALLHLAGSAAGPWAHAVSLGRTRTEAQQGPRKAPPPAHDERDCAVCQAFGAAPIPAEPPVLPFTQVEPAQPVFASGSMHASAAPAAANARAPPSRSA